MKKIAALAVGLLLAISFSPVSADTYTDLIEKAEAYIQSGDYSKAAASYHLAQRLDPQNEAAYLGDARLCFMTEDYAAATASLEAALAIDPLSAEAWLVKCDVDIAMGDLEAFGEDADFAQVCGADLTECFISLAQGCLDAGDMEGALSYLGRIEPLDTGGYEKALSMELDFPEAEPMVEKWRAAYADLAESDVAQAMENGQWDEARAAAERALTVCGDERFQALLDQCSWQVREGNYALAMEKVRSGDYEGVEELLAGVGDYEDAPLVLRHVTAGEAGRNYLNALYSPETDPRALAALFADAGDYEDAPARARDFLEQADAADYDRAAALMNDGQWEQARAIFEALGADYRECEGMILICEDGLRRQRYEEALQMMARGDFSAAEAVFSDMGDYGDSRSNAALCRINLKEERYQTALSLYDSGDREEAYLLFSELDGYRDSAVYRVWIESERGSEE